jgi:hypothetical protein
MWGHVVPLHDVKLRENYAIERPVCNIIILILFGSSATSENLYHLTGARKVCLKFYIPVPKHE